jgi:hypothetical protein
MTQSATLRLSISSLRGRRIVGRQSQTWVRFPDVGSKVVSAHVSILSEKAF